MYSWVGIGTRDYEGEYVEDRRHGRGTLYWGDGTTIHYEGEWARNQRHGQGHRARQIYR